MNCGCARASRLIERWNSGSPREPNSNAERGRERKSWAFSFAEARRFVMNRPPIGGRGGGTRAFDSRGIAAQFQMDGACPDIRPEGKAKKRADWICRLMTD